MSTVSREVLEEIFGRKEKQFIGDWSDFLRFKSISADPAHEKDCLACAEWLMTHLGKMGFETELLPTNGKPVVYAEWKGKPGSPTVVYYGHYDVQPVDPLELWKSDPFTPTMRDGRLYARGAQDNKGQTAYFLKAVETLIDQKALTCGLKLFIEGEEEVGSEGIAEAIPKWGARLKGDVLMVCDTGLVPSGAPTITMGLRGLVKLEATITGPKYDLHSGVHGGVCRNPASELARLVASLHNPDGSIAVKGFYDSVTEVSAQDKKLANEFQIPPDMYAAMTGVLPEGGEQKFSVVERRGFRPTIEVNGLYSGYMGKGSKTIIPSKGVVKISSRIVGGQKPEEVLQMITDHLKAHTPKGVTLEISDTGISGPALLLSSKSKPIGLAKKVLDSISEQKTVHMWEGASVPIVASLWKHSGAEPVLVGFGKEEDQIHAPNESFSISQFKSGFLYAALFLNALQEGR